MHSEDTKRLTIRISLPSPLHVLEEYGIRRDTDFEIAIENGPIQHAVLISDPAISGSAYFQLVSSCGKSC